MIDTTAGCWIWFITFFKFLTLLASSSSSSIHFTGSRIANLTLLASPLVILAPVAYFTKPECKINRFAWNYGVWAIEKAGPTFVKLVQWATTRNDLFSTSFIDNFSKLQDNTMGHSWKDTKVLLEDSYGKNYMDLFDFDNEYDQIGAGVQQQEGKEKIERSNHKRHRGDSVSPIGSGCIAQVYKAKLKMDTTLLPKGSDVAIKVTHPHILHKVCVDFYILNKITKCMEAVPYLNLDYLSMKDSVEQFRDIMLPQLDLRVEASNLRRFRRDFADDPRVEFPQPIGDLTTEKVLVEAFVHGEPILNYCDEGRKPTKDREHLAKLGFETVMKMVFLYDFVHGDLHPGMLQLLIHVV